MGFNLVFKGLRKAVYPVKWLRLTLWNGTEDGNVRSVKQMKAPTVLMEEVTLVSRGG